MLYDHPPLCPHCINSEGHLAPDKDCTVCLGTFLIILDWRPLVIMSVCVLAAISILAFLRGVS